MYVLNFTNFIKTPNLFALVAVGACTVCSSDNDKVPQTDNGQGRLGIYAAAAYSPTFGKNNLDGNVIQLSSFLVNIDGIELEYDDINDDTYNNGDDDIELKGPFKFDLLNPNPIEIIIVDLPNGRLEK